MLRLLSPLYLFSFTLIALIAAGELKASAQYAEQARYVRVTTGATQFRNWERPLIQGNPNLSHFTWVPVTGYHQGRQRVIQRRGPDSQVVQTIPGSRQKSVYASSKPIAVPLNYIAARPSNPEVHGAVHVPTVVPKKPRSASDQAAIHGAIRVPFPGEGDLFGKLARQQADQALAARMQLPTVATYSSLPGSLHPASASAAVQGQGSSKSVHGLLKAAFRDR